MSGGRDSWEETDDGENVSITFDGVDATRRATAEIAEVRSPMMQSRRALPGIRAVVWVIRVLVATAISYLVAILLAVFIGVEAAYAVTFAGIIFIGVLFFVEARQQRQKARALVDPSKQNFEDRFRLRLGPNDLTLEGTYLLKRTWPLSMVERVEGGRRLTLVMRDGEYVELACTMTTPERHDELADRINTVLASIRANNAGYRG